MYVDIMMSNNMDISFLEKFFKISYGDYSLTLVA